MLRHLSAARWMSLCSAVLLAACGGSGGGAGAPTGGATQNTTLSIIPSALVLSVNDTVTSPALTGNPRVFTVTNTGSVTAQSVIWAVSTGSPALPSGTNVVSTCGILAPGANCTLTVTPGGGVSAAPGVQNPVPVTLSLGGSNTNLLTPTVQVLTYGSVHQSGYVFSIDDTTSSDGNIGGKAAALSDIAASPLPWSTTLNLINASSLTDGQSNTQSIVAVYDALSVPRASYAAGACMALADGGFNNWYLPAICEMSSGAAGCAAQQNMQSNLIENSTVAGSPTWHWSSTEAAALPTLNGIQHRFAMPAPPPGPGQQDDVKSNIANVRCVRSLS